MEKELRNTCHPDNAQAKSYPQGICANHTLNSNDPQSQIFKVKKKNRAMRAGLSAQSLFSSLQ